MTDRAGRVIAGLKRPRRFRVCDADEGLPLATAGSRAWPAVNLHQPERSAMPTNIVLVRHGQTAWNTTERFRGRADVPLNPAGRLQAEAVALSLAAEVPAAAVISSPLQRAADTGRAIAAAQGLELEISEAITDIDYGRFAGLSQQEAREQFPRLYRAWLSCPHSVTFPGGESLADVRARLSGLLWPLAERYAGRRVVLVTHLAVCRSLFCYLLQLPESGFWCIEFGTASVSEFRLRRGHSALVRANVTSHLTSLRAS
jgi:broad specificity phosphatase PhoE